MVEGEKVRLWIPESLAYKGQSAPYGMLVFDVELIKISEAR
jgi:FKBP-type peptidyl-prolyl cis-trans isomerase